MDYVPSNRLALRTKSAPPSKTSCLSPPTPHVLLGPREYFSFFFKKKGDASFGAQINIRSSARSGLSLKPKQKYLCNKNGDEINTRVEAIDLKGYR